MFVISLERASDTLIFMKNKKEAMATLEIGVPTGTQRHEQGLTILCLLISTTREVRYD